MALSAKFYTFKKRENSTKQPTASDTATTYDVVLKDSCGVLNPVLRVSTGGSNPTSLNYCYFAEFGRYYFVTGWTWEKPFWTVSLAVDVLASYKTQIGSMSKYVLRAASLYNYDVADSMYPCVGGRLTHETELATRDKPFNVADGTFVIGIISRPKTASSATGAVQYYKMTSAELYVFLNDLMSNEDWLDIDQADLASGLQRVLFNPFQYVASAMFFPFDISNGTPKTSIYYGWWSFSTMADALDEGLDRVEFLDPFYLNIHKHPLAGTRGGWLNLPPYSNYVLRIYPWGDIELDASLLADATQIQCDPAIDLVTGLGTLTISARNAAGYIRQIAVYSAQIGVPMQIAQINQDLKTGAIGAAVGKTASFLANGFESGSKIANALSGIASTAGAVGGTLSTQGSNGSIVNYYLDIILQHQYFMISADANDEIGKPLCTTATLSTLSGFVQVLDGDNDVPCYDSERGSIRSYLEGGFFIE